MQKPSRPSVWNPVFCGAGLSFPLWIMVFCYIYCCWFLGFCSGSAPHVAMPQCQVCVSVSVLYFLFYFGVSHVPCSVFWVLLLIKFNCVHFCVPSPGLPLVSCCSLSCYQSSVICSVFCSLVHSYAYMILNLCNPAIKLQLSLHLSPASYSNLIFLWPTLVIMADPRCKW